MPIELEIVSPERLLLARPVDMVVMPGSEGDLGVLGGHAPMIILLRGGVIALHEGGRVTDRLFVAGGFAEITPERVTVLADEAQPVAEVSRAAAQTRLTEAQAQLAAVPRGDVPAEDAALVHVQAAQAMVAAAEAA
jgi:F-type H+-transporting ATPase subunit epsilon